MKLNVVAENPPNTKIFPVSASDIGSEKSVCVRNVCGYGTVFTFNVDTAIDPNPVIWDPFAHVMELSPFIFRSFPGLFNNKPDPVIF